MDLTDGGSVVDQWRKAAELKVIRVVLYSVKWWSFGGCLTDWRLQTVKWRRWLSKNVSFFNQKKKKDYYWEGETLFFSISAFCVQ